MTEVVKSLQDSIDSVERQGAISFLSQAERTKAIFEQLGFFPQSNDEASRIMTLIGRGEAENPVRTHLDEVARHQYSAKANARAAVESITQRFADYAGNAADEKYLVQSFIKRQADAELANFTSFATAYPVDEWHDDATLKATFTAMSRYLDTEIFTETARPDTPGKYKLIDNTVNEDRTAHIVSTLGALRVSSLTSLAKALEVNQENRLAFWSEKLVESQQHAFATKIAEVALQDLFDRGVVL